MPPAIDTIFETAAADAGWWITTGVLAALSGLAAYGGWLGSHAAPEARRRGLLPPLRGLSARLWSSEERWERRYDRLEDYLATLEPERPARRFRERRPRFRVRRGREVRSG